MQNRTVREQGSSWWNPGSVSNPWRGKRCEAPLDPLRPISEGGEKCGQSAKEGGFCIKHGGGKRCIMPNCHKGAKNGDFCISHSHMSEEKKLSVMRDMGIRVMEGTGGLTKSVTRVAAELQDKKRAHVRTTKAAQALARATEVAIRLERERVGAEGADDILVGIRKGGFGAPHPKVRSPTMKDKTNTGISESKVIGASAGRLEPGSGDNFSEQGGPTKRMKMAESSGGNNSSGHIESHGAQMRLSGSVVEANPPTVPLFTHTLKSSAESSSSNSSTNLNANETAHLLLSLTDSVVGK